jgi:hypothetical protein
LRNFYLPKNIVFILPNFYLPKNIAFISPKFLFADFSFADFVDLIECPNGTYLLG